MTCDKKGLFYRKTPGRSTFPSMSNLVSTFDKVWELIVDLPFVEVFLAI